MHLTVKSNLTTYHKVSHPRTPYQCWVQSMHHLRHYRATLNWGAGLRNFFCTGWLVMTVYLVTHSTDWQVSSSAHTVSLQLSTLRPARAFRRERICSIAPALRYGEPVPARCFLEGQIACHSVCMHAVARNCGRRVADAWQTHGRRVADVAKRVADVTSCGQKTMENFFT